MKATLLRGLQEGTVLVVSLLILLLMTIIGVTAMNTNTLEEKMAGNTRDRNLALQAAESALRDGENWLSGLIGKPESCSAAPCNLWQLNVLDLSTMNWNSDGRLYSQGTALGVGHTLAEAPRFVIEQAGYKPDSLKIGTSYPSPGLYYYRVTARGRGGTTAAQVLLQTTYIRRY